LAINLQKIKKIILRLLVISLFFLFFLVIYLDSKVKHEFKQQAWDIPAKVYARSLSFSLGQSIDFNDLLQELKLLGYRNRIKAVNSGEYESYQQTLVIHTRPFKFWDGEQSSQLIQLTINNNKISSLKDFSSQKSINYLRLDPLLLGDIQVNPHKISQDRQLINLDELPQDFVAALLVTEDRNFYQHWGISLKGIARALWQNISDGEMTQGGSTITQQLMKNHFLSNERSLWRKGNEAIMALLTEYHYDKKTILQAYINEVYLGQNRNSAIHGFSRASEFYFDTPLKKLNLSQVALLIGIVKGPSFYNPRNQPERAKQRRDLVLLQMKEQGIIDEQDYLEAVERSLMVVKKPSIRNSRVPAFFGLVKKELSSDYNSEQLKKDGLKLFTSLDPILQAKAEKSLSKRIKQLPNGEQLQGAIILTDIASGEIEAVVGDKHPSYVGFNRAIDAYRQTGSVIKPIVYLTALQRPEQFNLATLVEDKEFSLTGNDGSLWKPQNYDKIEHGDKDGMVSLSEGLVNSYNLATARLAMKVGLDEVVETINQTGFERDIAAFPSIALGSKEMSPLEVLTLYQVIANNGMSVKPQAIIAVQDQQGHLLNRYSRTSERVIEPEAAYLIRYLLTKVAQQGTAKSISWRFPNQVLAGKTGTTNDLRDSWYAGFDQNKLAVVWLGRDDNQPMGLTGANGSLLVWADLFNQFELSSINLSPPSGIVFGYKDGGFFSRFSSCSEKTLIPFYESDLPAGYQVCNQ